MKIKVKDLKTGIIYTNDMNDKNEHTILSIDFCTSYKEINVQDKIIDENGKKKYPTKTLIAQPIGSEPYWVDLIATQGDDEGIFI